MRLIKTTVILVLVFFPAAWVLSEDEGVPDAPMLTVRVTGNNVLLSWTSAAGADGYTLYYTPSPCGKGPVGSLSMGDRRALSLDLWEGASFHVAVQAYNGSGSGGFSNIQSFTTSASALEKKLQELLDETVAETGTTGAVLHLRSPDFQWTGAGGLADRGAGIPMKTGDMLRIASMTKTFVSVVVQKLHEEGKLDLDHPMGGYLPDDVAENITNGAEVTIRQLLAMTSGIKSYTECDSYNDALENDPYGSPRTAHEIVEFIYSENAVFPPGKGWDYSNTNYILLDMIVRKRCGTSLAAEMRRIIHEPLGLENIFMEIQEPRPGGFGGLTVHGYEDGGEDVTCIQDALGLGDGGLISDARGVAGFLQALFGDKTLLCPASLSGMTDFHTVEDYGLGLERRMTEFGEAWGHSGASSGFQGDMLFFPGRDIIFVILTNTMDSGADEVIFQKVMPLLTGP